MAIFASACIEKVSWRSAGDAFEYQKGRDYRCWRTIPFRTFLEGHLTRGRVACTSKAMVGNIRSTPAMRWGGIVEGWCLALEPQQTKVDALPKGGD